MLSSLLIESLNSWIHNKVRAKDEFKENLYSEYFILLLKIYLLFLLHVFLPEKELKQGFPQRQSFSAQHINILVLSK